MASLRRIAKAICLVFLSVLLIREVAADARRLPSNFSIWLAATILLGVSHLVDAGPLALGLSAGDRAGFQCRERRGTRSMLSAAAQVSAAAGTLLLLRAHLNCGL